MSDDDSISDDDTEVVDIDDNVKDREPEQMPDVDYDKKDPPVTVRTVYSDMDAFKIALASHVVKNEFNYDIEKSDPGRYRANCAFKSEGCKWRIHASTLQDDVRVKVIC
jgi:predicted DNA binding CopG/RHH family protein